MRAAQIVLVLLPCLLLGGAVSASAAAQPDFAGYCTLDYGNSTTAYCSFSSLTDTAEADPSSCPGSWISRFEWDLGDGNFFDDDSFVMTSYTDAINTGSVTVRLRMTCGDSTQATASRNVVFVNIGCGRCINMNNGWD